MAFDFYTLVIAVCIFHLIQLPRYIWWILRLAIACRPRGLSRAFKEIFIRGIAVIVPYLIQSFAYEPAVLGGDRIRLLKIEERRWGILCCSLHTFPIDVCPNYTALSYTWRTPNISLISWILNVFTKLRRLFTLLNEDSGGNQSDTSAFKEQIRSINAASRFEERRSSSTANASKKRLIICNGKAMQITQNLYDALNMIPATRHDLTGYWWVDQICIDQSNLTEKNVQVPQMGSIYSRARLVAVWLGVPWAFEVEAPKAACESFTEDYTKSPNGPVRMARVLRYTALVILLSRAWFRRVWTVQEVVHARQITFFLGDQEIPLNHFLAAVRSLKQYIDFYDLDLLKIVPTREIMEVFDARESYSPEEGWSLERWLRICRGREASDRKDMLFAGVSLMSNADKLRFEVDYSKTEDQVFTDLTENLIFSENGIETLCLAERGEFSKLWLKNGRSSWEINIDFTVHCRPLPRHQFKADFSQIFAAVRIDRSRYGAFLHANAIILDTVKTVVDVRPIFSNISIDVLSRIILDVGSEYSWTKEHPLAAVARTLTAGQCTKHKLSSEYIVAKMTEMLTTLLTAFKSELVNGEWPEIRFPDQTRPVGYHESYIALSRAFPKLAWDRLWEPLDEKLSYEELFSRHVMVAMSHKSRAPSADDQFIPLMLAASQERNLFITHKGMLGLGPICTKPQDEVAILKGSRVPFVISKGTHDVNVDKILGSAQSSVARVENLTRMFKLTQTVSKDLDNLLKQEALTENVNALFENMLKGEVDNLEKYANALHDGRVLRGETYLHGFMNGEAETLLEAHERIWQDITFR